MSNGTPWLPIIRGEATAGGQVSEREFDIWLRGVQAEILMAAASQFAVDHEKFVTRGDVRRYLEENARLIIEPANTKEKDNGDTPLH